jgi:hypothetical protein
MKKLIAIIILSLAALWCHAQGNLQFNQVVNYTISTPLVAANTNPSQTLTITVPVGKTIKIESSHISYQIGSSPIYYVGNSTNPSGHLVLNGGVIAAFNLEFPLHHGPIWLGAGTHTLLLQGFANSGSSYRWNAFVSGIEFNIVP